MECSRSIQRIGTGRAYFGRDFSSARNLVRILRRCGIVDHRGEIRPTIDGECRKLHRKRSPATGVVQSFVGFAMPLNIVVAPHRCEFGTGRAQLVDQRLDFPGRAARATSARNDATTNRATLCQFDGAARTSYRHRIEVENRLGTDHHRRLRVDPAVNVHHIMS